MKYDVKFIALILCAFWTGALINGLTVSGTLLKTDTKETAMKYKYSSWNKNYFPKGFVKIVRESLERRKDQA